MLNINHPDVARLLFTANFGLEKESLRIDQTGHLSHTPHEFADGHIVRDFCENQTEINTDVHPTLQQTMDELLEKTKDIQRFCKERNELLWPFSSPPLIRNEEDIPIANVDKPGRSYREYLSNRYGRYKMTFCGIHYNFSFSDALLEAGWKADLKAEEDKKSFPEWKNDLYLDLANKASSMGWLINVLTAASPLVDGSYYEKKLMGKTCFTGLASMRNSELGYWNFFTPVLDYSSIEAYIQAITKYTRKGYLKEARELYYPIRLKPRGKYSLEALKQDGISHIELRMLDLNPTALSGLDMEDASFVHLFLVYLAALPPLEQSGEYQLLTEQNFKNAAHYDLKTIKIVDFSECSQTVYDAAWALLQEIRTFYQNVLPGAVPLIDRQILKLSDPQTYRYAWRLRDAFADDYVGKGIALAKRLQDELLKEPLRHSCVLADF